MFREEVAQVEAGMKKDKALEDRIRNGQRFPNKVRFLDFSSTWCKTAHCLQP